jgi:hypothetical protein
VPSLKHVLRAGAIIATGLVGSTASGCDSPSGPCMQVEESCDDVNECSSGLVCMRVYVAGNVKPRTPREARGPREESPGPQPVGAEAVAPYARSSPSNTTSPAGPSSWCPPGVTGRGERREDPARPGGSPGDLWGRGIAAALPCRALDRGPGGPPVGPTQPGPMRVLLGLGDG